MARLSTALNLRSQQTLYIQEQNDERQALGRATQFDADAAIISDGTNDPDSADGPQGTVHVWFRLASIPTGGNTATIITRNASRLIVDILDTGILRVRGQNNSGVDVLDLRTTTVLSVDTWYHMVASWDLDPVTPETRLYLNDADDLNEVLATSGESVDYAASAYVIGARDAGGQRFDGHIAELWFVTEFLDVADDNIRYQFLTEEGLGRKFLGKVGERPMRTAGLSRERANIYMRGGIDTLRKNVGSGDDFSNNLNAGGATENPTSSEWPPIRIGI